MAKRTTAAAPAVQDATIPAAHMNNLCGDVIELFGRHGRRQTILTGKRDSAGQPSAISGGSLVTPVMTANNAPAGYTASASNEANGSAFNAFRRDGSNSRWGTNTTSGALTIQLPSAKTVLFYGVGGDYQYTSSAPKNWTLQGSNNGSSWTTLDTRTNQTDWTINTNGFEVRSFAVTTPGSYLYYKLDVTLNNGHGSLTAVSELYLLERPSNTVGAVDVLASNTEPFVYSFAAGFDKDGQLDQGGAYVTDQADVWTSLPTPGAGCLAVTVALYMDRNTSTGAITYGYQHSHPVYYQPNEPTPFKHSMGIALTNGTESGTAPGLVQNGNNSDYWGSSHTGAGVNGVDSIGFDLGAVCKINALSLEQSGAGANDVTSVKVQTSANGSSWSDVQTFAISVSAAEQALTLSSPAYARYVRVLANSGTSSGPWRVYRLTATAAGGHWFNPATMVMKLLDGSGTWNAVQRLFVGEALVGSGGHPIMSAPYCYRGEFDTGLVAGAGGTIQAWQGASAADFTYAVTTSSDGTNGTEAPSVDTYFNGATQFGYAAFYASNWSRSQLSVSVAGSSPAYTRVRGFRLW